MLDEYIRVIHKNTEFFSTFDAPTILSALEQFAQESGYTITVAKDKYKIKLQILLEEGEVEMNAKILKVDDSKVCVEFSKVSGTDSIKFYEKFNNIKEYLGEFINATY